MGLFNRNKKTYEEQYQELYNTNLSQIKNANYVVRLDFAVGQYGNEDIIAGAMIGETGKYLMMGKYGDLKWDSTTMALLNDGIRIHYNGVMFHYSDLREVRVTDTNKVLHGEKQLVLVTTNGDYIFKSQSVFIDVIINIILNSRDRYNGWVDDGLINAGDDLSDDDIVLLMNGESLNKNEDNSSNGEKDIDRLIQLGDLYEKGLLSDEEFKAAKEKLLK